MTEPLDEPTRPTPAEVATELADHVRALAGPDAVARPEQLAAVTAVVADRRRTLLVARTGFGKSAVYFSATAMLRRRGWGPTVVVSPLLALMRDQVAAAERLGLRAATINSSNIDAWAAIEDELATDSVDLLLIAPERLANPGFRARVFDEMRRRPMALVCDEAHCISDWGHDFRPDYRRLRTLLAELPAWTPVLATTATANARVTDDVARQLGDDTLVLRTSLDRSSLHLSVVDLPDDAHRLAWLAETLPDLPGSGIVYCLTVDQAETTAAWLTDRGLAVAAYTGAVEPERRLELETALRDNALKALTATSALGMGFDKGDLAFCVHLGLPPSPVAYYQQIGRAGRNLDRAEVIAVPRPAEDESVWRWFESVSTPPEALCRSVLDQLHRSEPTSIAALETMVNLGRTRLGTLLSILDVDGAVARVGNGWIRTDDTWRYDHEAVEELRRLRRVESDQMRAWAGLDGCRLAYLRRALDDVDADACGRCDRCLGVDRWRLDPAVGSVAAAQAMLRGSEIVVEPRRQWPSGLDDRKGRIPGDAQFRPGRALARLGDGGWGPRIDALITAAVDGHAVALDAELVDACATVLKRWTWDARPTWICPMPSRHRSALITGVASELGRLGKLPVVAALEIADPSGPPQAAMSNSAHQVRGAAGFLKTAPVDAPAGPVLLVDDEAASRWTLTVAATLLHHDGHGPVLPFVLRTRA